MYLRTLACLLFFSCLTNNCIAEDFVVGTTSAYAPYVSLNEQGQYVGFDIDMAKALAEKLNRRLVIKDLGSMPSLFLALKQEKVDALIWAISITAERQQQMEMVYYQGAKVTSLPLLFWQNIPKNFQSIEDMANAPSATIAVEAGSFQESALNSFQGLAIKYVDKVMDAILEIKYRKSMATIVDPSLLSKLTKQFPQIKVLEVPLPLSKQALGNGICLNKKNTKLIAEVRQVVLELQSEGKIAELEQKWDLKDK